MSTLRMEAEGWLPAERTDSPWRPLPRAIVLFYVLTFFIPDGVAFPLGTIQLTPQHVVSMIVLPALLFSGGLRWVLPDTLIVAYLLMGMVSYARSDAFESAAEVTGRQTLELVGPYLLGRWVAQRDERCNAAVGWVVCGLVAAATFVVIESVLRFNIHREFWQYFGKVGNLIHAKERMGLARAKAWAGHPIMLGFMYAGFLPLVLYAVGERTRRFGAAPAAMTIAFLVATFFTVSSGAWIAAAIVIGLWFWEYRVRMRADGKWLLAWVGVPLLYLLLEVASGRPLLRILMMKLHVTSSGAWRYRWALYRRVEEALQGHEWLGWGLVRPESFRDFGTSVDNHYLLVELLRGRIGLWLWIAFMVAVVFVRPRAVWFGSDTPTARLARAACFGVIALAIGQLSAALFSSGAITFWFIGGLAVGLGVRAAQEAREAAAGDDEYELADRMETTRG